MSLRDRIPEQLRLSDSIIAITLEEDVGVFDTGDYVLIEVSHNAGRINVPKIAQTVNSLVKREKKMVAVRGFGFKGVGLGVRIAHEIKKLETRFINEMTFDTFEATESADKQTLTSIQIIIMPPE
ncbi:MAG: hypothetical protein KAQ65_03350 [Candidatus Thorarchaeota archaeon]|nr:hypothetical protein [Candidatus Thorarchaeota archaeon]